MNFLERTSLDYQYLFDICAYKTQQTSAKTVLIRTAAASFTYELARRIAPLLNPDVSLAALYSGDFQHPLALVRGDQNIHNLHEDNIESFAPYDLIVWVEPTTPETNTFLPNLSRLLAPDGKLVVCFSRPLARLIPEGKRQSAQPVRAKIMTLLRHQRFTIHELYSFHGPVSLFWWQASVGLNRLHRAALADRCWYRMRANFHADGWQTSFATTSVLVAAL